MAAFTYVALCAVLVQVVFAAKSKTVHSEDDSKIEDEEIVQYRSDPTYEHKKKDTQYVPYMKHMTKNRVDESDSDHEGKEKEDRQQEQRLSHPNELIFPLIYKQVHINSMFKIGDNWYTWSTEKKTDGSKAVNYYKCYDEPKHCDDVGWERIEQIPKCAFEINYLLHDDRACINNFGVEPHNRGVCELADQMKVSEMVRVCGPRIRSLWRFFRVGRRSPSATKPADVNSLICEDEEECFISIEYRIHHDRITFSLHEPTRGQTFKSVLKREVTLEEEKEKTTTETPRIMRRRKKPEEYSKGGAIKKTRSKLRNKHTERKAVTKDDIETPRSNNKIKVAEDISEDFSE